VTATSIQRFLQSFNPASCAASPCATLEFFYIMQDPLLLPHDAIHTKRRTPSTNDHC